MDATANDAVIEFHDVHKQYGNERVLQGIDFMVRKGEVIAIIGPSGGGKSTVLRCVNGLVPVTSGRVVIEGQDITRPDVDLNRVRQHLGMVFQAYNLFPHLKIIDNLTLAPRKLLRIPRTNAEERAHELLARVGLTDKAHHRPRQLSGGQQQRVAIARALMMNPHAMLFDEVTSALDPELISEVLQVMRDLARSGMTMLCVTHEIGFARELADRVMFLDDGEVVEEGAVAEVIDKPSNPRTRSFLDRVLR